MRPLAEFDELNNGFSRRSAPNYMESTTTPKRKAVVKRLTKLAAELLRYLKNNADSIPDYGRRYRAGERISTAFVESAVNQIIDKRMSKSQQMRWSPQGAHLLIQVRTSVLDGRLRQDFARWHPGFAANDSDHRLCA